MFEQRSSDGARRPSPGPDQGGKFPFVPGPEQSGRFPFVPGPEQGKGWPFMPVPDEGWRSPVK